MRNRLAAAAVLALCPLAPAVAGEAGDITREALYSGALRPGLEQLEPLAASDPEAAFGKGLIDFVIAIEGFAQDLYRYGLAGPETGPMGPPIAVPVPPNADPEPLDYETVRAVLERVVTQLDLASAELEAAGRSGDYVVRIDPLRIRIDIDGDGTTEEAESIGRVFAPALGVSGPGATPTPMTPSVPPAERSGEDKTSNTPSPEAAAPAATTTEIGFDRADAIWLAGYSQVFAAQADFFLAHDFSDFVNASFHRLFPRARLPMEDYAEGGMLVVDPETDTAIADLVAAIHTIDWPVVEPDRLQRVLARFGKITGLSRANWDAILAETDDERELIPNPRQTSIVPDGEVTDETVAAWRETLDVADRILAGELLVPHWRFKQGFDLKAFFETSPRFDLVMLLTGYDALPYLRDGPVASAESFAAANRVFGDQFLGYIFWFN